MPGGCKRRRIQAATVPLVVFDDGPWNGTFLIFASNPLDGFDYATYLAAMKAVSVTVDVKRPN